MHHDIIPRRPSASPAITFPVQDTGSLLTCDASTDRCELSTAKRSTIQCGGANPLRLNHVVLNRNSKQYWKPTYQLGDTPACPRGLIGFGTPDWMWRDRQLAAQHLGWAAGCLGRG